MSPREQQEAIAELHGYRIKDRDPEAWHPLPDYLIDLNAMHEAEKTLTAEQRRLYANEVLPDVMHEHYLSELIFATAAQRAEAFLKTIGKWKD